MSSIRSVSMSEFSPAFFGEVKRRLQEAVKTVAPPWVAAFDADGTLWNTDVGENFFDYQIQHSQLSLPPDPWSEYLDKKAISPPTAYLWLAQINQGVNVQKVREWAEACFQDLNPFPFFHSQMELIRFMHDLGISVYVVSASVQWSVEPAARRLGIGHERVLGVKTSVEKGVVTRNQDGPITWKEGKVDALLKATGGVKPIFAAGNTTGDLPLMESATHIRLAIGSSTSIVPEAEAQLRAVAGENGWFIHQF